MRAQTSMGALLPSGKAAGHAHAMTGLAVEPFDHVVHADPPPVLDGVIVGQVGGRLVYAPRTDRRPPPLDPWIPFRRPHFRPSLAPTRPMSYVPLLPPTLSATLMTSRCPVPSTPTATSTPAFSTPPPQVRLGHTPPTNRYG